MSQNKKVLQYVESFLIVTLGYFSIFLAMYYIIAVAKGQYHSDCTDTIMWAQASLDGHSVMNKDFSYAGLIPFGGNLIMLPFVAIYGVSIKAQIMGMVTFAIIFIAAVIFLARSMKLEFEWIFIMLASILFVTCSGRKLREIFWEHIIYYSLGLLFIMVGFGIVLRCINGSEEQSEDRSFKGVIKWYVILFIFTTLALANGVQALTLYGIPVLGAIVAERFFDFKKPLVHKKYIDRYITVAVMIFATICGLLLGKLVNAGLKAGYAEAYSTFSTSDLWVENFLSFFPKFFTLLGVNIKPSMLMYSREGIVNLIRIVFAIILMAVPVIMALMYQYFEELSYRLMIFIHHFMTALILLGWVFGKLNSANWRLSPIVISSVILCVMFARWLFKRIDYRRIAVVLAIPFLCMSFIITFDVFKMKKQTTENKSLEKLEQCLESNGLEYGYSTFWQSNIITLMSDSKVKVRVINLDEDGYRIRYYQTNKHWYGEVQGYDRYFIVLTKHEYENYYENEKLVKTPEEMIICGDFRIMVYEDNIFH